MGLNPSNGIAAREAQATGKTAFPNLARRDPVRHAEVYDQPAPPPDILEKWEAEKAEVDKVVHAELTAAGLIHSDESQGDKIVDWFPEKGGEVPTKWTGFVCDCWKLRRAWYYWVAEGPALPFAVAYRLYQQDKSIRVEGDCSAPRPRIWGCPSYHVDTTEGLKLLVETIKQVCAIEEAMDITPDSGRADITPLQAHQKGLISSAQMVFLNGPRNPAVSQMIRLTNWVAEAAPMQFSDMAYKIKDSEDFKAL